MSTLSLVAILLVLYQIKHFVADYLLQTPYMLKKFLPGWDFALPLAAHAGVHALFTLGIMLLLAPHLWYLCLLDFAAHFVIDRVKAGPKYLGRYKALMAAEFKRVINTYTHANDSDAKTAAKEKLRGNTLFWIALGADQMFHHLTHYVIIYIVAMDSMLSC